VIFKGFLVFSQSDGQGLLAGLEFIAGPPVTAAD
jgi:hypothetical protein